MCYSSLDSHNGTSRKCIQVSKDDLRIINSIPECFETKSVVCGHLMSMIFLGSILKKPASASIRPFQGKVVKKIK